MSLVGLVVSGEELLPITSSPYPPAQLLPQRSPQSLRKPKEDLRMI